MNDQNKIINGVFRHYNTGNYYIVRAIAINTENRLNYVVYQQLVTSSKRCEELAEARGQTLKAYVLDNKVFYEPLNPIGYFTREETEFLADVCVNGEMIPRFKRIERRG